jgi:hypothetical protein
LDVADLGFGALDDGLAFAALDVVGFFFGIARVRRDAGACFAAFRPRLAMVPPVEV